MSESRVMRPIRSFVRREGRLTPGQQKALDELWPRFGIDDTHEAIDLDSLFGRHAPVVLEIGFGNGASLAEMAQNQPEQNFIGIEVHRPGVGQLLKSIQTLALNNVRVACTDAVELLRHRIPDNSLDLVQIYFPISGIRSDTINVALFSLLLSRCWPTNSSMKAICIWPLTGRIMRNRC